MNVGELIDQLKEYPKDLEVKTPSTTDEELVKLIKEGLDKLDIMIEIMNWRM